MYCKSVKTAVKTPEIIIPDKTILINELLRFVFEIKYVNKTAQIPNTNAEILIDNTGTTIAKAAPTAEPDDIPNVKGSTIGFLKIACKTLPDDAKAAPTINVNTIRGKRTCHKIVSILD